MSSDFEFCPKPCLDYRESGLCRCARKGADFTELLDEELDDYEDFLNEEFDDDDDLDDDPIVLWDDGNCTSISDSQLIADSFAEPQAT